MGGGSGFGYRFGPSSGEAFVKNFGSAAKEFPMDHQNKFGTESVGKNVQEIQSRDPLASAEKLFKMLSQGGKPVSTERDGVKVVSFEDGTHIVFRPISKSGSPAVDINPGTTAGKVTSQHKIHFERKS